MRTRTFLYYVYVPCQQTIKTSGLLNKARNIIFAFYKFVFIQVSLLSHQ